MVANIPKSERPTHQLAKRLHARHQKATGVEIKTALKLEEAAGVADVVIGSVTAIAAELDVGRTSVMRAIRKMRKLNLIAAEFFGLGDELHVIVMCTRDQSVITCRMLEVIEAWSMEKAIAKGAA